MSELTDMVKSFEGLIKEKPVLEAQLANLRKNIDGSKAELEELEKSKSVITAKIKREEEEAKERVREYNEKQGSVIGKEIARLQKLEKSTNELCSDQAETARKQKQQANELAAREQHLIEAKAKYDRNKIEIEVMANRAKIQQEESSVDLAKTESQLRKIELLKVEVEQLKEDADEAKSHNRNTRLSLETKKKENEEYKAELDAFKVELTQLQEDIGKESDKVNKKWKEYYELKAIVNQQAKNNKDLQRGLEAEKAELAFQMAKVKGKK